METADLAPQQPGRAPGRGRGALVTGPGHLPGEGVPPRLAASPGKGSSLPGAHLPRAAKTQGQWRPTRLQGQWDAPCFFHEGGGTVGPTGGTQACGQRDMDGRTESRNVKLQLQHHSNLHGNQLLKEASLFPW